MEENSNALENAFLQSTIGDEKVALRAEDVQGEGGIDYEKHFFEPQPGNTYLVKFLPNPGGQSVTHRSLYTKLPDPGRKGKTFHYVSSGNANTCTVLDLFFDLHAKRKNGDAIAEQKIKKYLGRRNQACCKVQILNSPNKKEIGNVRLMMISTSGNSTPIIDLLDTKLNPSEDDIANGYEREDIFNIFESSVMTIKCSEETFGDDGTKGRSFSGSSWAPKKRGAIGIIVSEEGKKKAREFKGTDIDGGKVVAEAAPFFKEFVKTVTHEDYDVHNYFAYKEVDDPKNTKETNEYLKKVFAKVDEIVPVLKTKSLQEIANYGKKDSNSNDEKDDSVADVMEESVPDELKDSMMNEDVDETSEPGNEPDLPFDEDEDDDISNIIND